MAKNKFFLTTKGFNAEVVVAAPLAYTTQSTYATFISTAAEGEIGIFNADTKTLLVSAGTIVPTPVVAATLAGSTTGGTLAASAYYIKYSYVSSTGGESVASAESTVTTTGTTSSITVTVPAGPVGTKPKFYIGTSTGAEGQYFLGTVGSTSILITTATGTSGTPLTTATGTMPSPAPIGANIFIAQKRDSLVHQTTPFKVAAGIVTITPYVAPVKQVNTLSTFPAAVAGTVWTVALFDTTPASQPYPAWNFSYTLKTGDTIATGVAGLLAAINLATDPQDAAFGQLVVATSGGSGDTSTLILTAIDFGRSFRVATRDGLNYLTSGIVNTATTAFTAGIGTYDNVSEVEGEGIIYSGVTTNYPAPINALPSEFGTAKLFAVSGTTYNTYLISFFESEYSSLPLERHFQKKYFVLFCPSSGTTPDATVAAILGF